jgi:signal transduction histidine kinase
MKRLFPQTLFGQTVLVLLAGIGLALLAGIWIWASDRREAVRTVGALAVAERIINVSRLVGDVPHAWRARLVEGASDPHFRVALSARQPEHEPAKTDGRGPSAIVAAYIRQALPGRTIVISIAHDPGGRAEGAAGAFGIEWHPGPGAGMGMGPGGLGRMGAGPMMHAPMMRGPLAHAAMSWRALEATVQLPDGQWLRFTTSVPDTGPTVSTRLMLALGLVAATIVLLSVWTVRRMTAPLAMLSQAALRLGRNVEAPPLAAMGTIEMRRAVDAFNEMQARLRHLIENRTLMLAAISHDLRTQLSLLRLRVEAADASEDRDRLLETISEMTEMLSTTLSFAREEARREEVRRVDVGALMSTIVSDMADAGLAVSQGSIADDAVADCKPIALRRAITNLIDNAVKYGGLARISLSSEAGHLSIAVEDDGPGIPEDQLELVTQPFYRLETSRNPESGGIGLGLSIAQSIAEDHGGELVLINRRGGGLTARIILPR